MWTKAGLVAMILPSSGYMIFQPNNFWGGFLRRLTLYFAASTLLNWYMRVTVGATTRKSSIDMEMMMVPSADVREIRQTSVSEGVL